MCSGKVYFDLAEKQEKDSRNDVAIIRLETAVSFAAKIN